jgi:hypothetical protein
VQIVVRKVIVVSACYSGGFIDPLQDDRALVITASRPDRRSFGCADESYFTYFGRAFSKCQSGDPKVGSRRLPTVSKTEDNDHSEPQISTSPLIEEHLQRWRGQMQ